VLRADHEVQLINVDRSGLGRGVDAIHVPSSRIFAQRRLRRWIVEFDPDIVLYVPSPSSTLASFARSFFLRRHAPRAAIGMVALLPRRHRSFAGPVIARGAPEVLFVPSYRSLLRASRFAINGELIGVGVDLERFRPPVEGEKATLRRRFGVSDDAYVYLHVGHLSSRRNLDALISLAGGHGTEVIVVGSTSTPESRTLRRRLEESRVRVIREVVPINEFYRMADCYVFPVIDEEGCVEVPLSVIEALSSGLPVLARPFGGLRDHLPSGEDLRYWESAEELAAFASALRDNGDVTVRDMSRFAWSNIAAGIVSSLEARIRA
jgi:glycosyltransferase involved in cell wall biosynthesis